MNLNHQLAVTLHPNSDLEFEGVSRSSDERVALHTAEQVADWLDVSAKQATQIMRDLVEKAGQEAQWAPPAHPVTVTSTNPDDPGTEPGPEAPAPITPTEPSPESSTEAEAMTQVAEARANVASDAATSTPDDTDDASAQTAREDAMVARSAIAQGAPAPVAASAAHRASTATARSHDDILTTMERAKEHDAILSAMEHRATHGSPRERDRHEYEPVHTIDGITITP